MSEQMKKSGWRRAAGVLGGPLLLIFRFLAGLFTLLGRCVLWIFPRLGRLPGIRPLRRLLVEFVGGIGLVLFPLPFSIFRRKLVGCYQPDGNLVFFCHPRLVVCMHLIWVGWLVALFTGLNTLFLQYGWDFRLPVAWVIWLWLAVLLVTIIALGVDLGRVAVGYLLLTLVVGGLGLMVLQLWRHIPVFARVWWALKSLPIGIEWGVPFAASLVIGLAFALMAAWQRLNDIWTLSPESNYLEHSTFESTDDQIPKGAKIIRANYACLLKKYLFCGYGDILVMDYQGAKPIRTIHGVLFASWHERALMTRLKTTRVDAVDEEHQAQLEEEAAAAMDTDMST